MASRTVPLPAADMTIRNMTNMFLAAVLMLCGQTGAFVHIAPAALRCSSHTTTAMSASAGLTRAEAIERGAAVAGSGVLAAGVLLGGLSPQQARAEQEEMKDEVQQFAELRGQVEKKGRDEVVRRSTFGGSIVCYVSKSCSLKDYRLANMEM